MTGARATSQPFGVCSDSNDRSGITIGYLHLYGGSRGPKHSLVLVCRTPTLAARLQTLAEPGAALISSETQSLIGGLFEYRDLGEVALPGFARRAVALREAVAAGIAAQAGS